MATDGAPPAAEVRLPEAVAWKLFARNLSRAEALPFVTSQGDARLVEPATRAVAVMTTSL